MAKVYDVPADLLIERLANILKSEDIPAPSWTPFVKTGAHADKPPQDSEWWHTRCASCLLYTSPSPRDLSTSRMPSSA